MPRLTRALTVGSEWPSLSSSSRVRLRLLGGGGGGGGGGRNDLWQILPFGTILLPHSSFLLPRNYFIEIEEVDEGLLLLGGPLEHVDGDVLGLLALKLWCQTQAGLGLGLVAVLGLEACREGGLVDIADGRHVVVGYPLP